MTAPVPLPEARDRWALFLDIDGTLIDIAPTPEAVRVTEGTHEVLARLAPATDGALAFVSGRAVADVDRLFAPLRLPVAGLHGLERRDAGGRLHHVPADPAALEPVRAALAEFVRDHPGCRLEDKGATLALHYRAAPAAEGAAETLIARLLAGRGDLMVQRGKMVREVRPAGSDKGSAVAAFMAEPPFHGRTPLFVGDDVTDEDGFAAAQALGGHAIRVGGAGPTAARHALASVAEVHRWLARVADAIEAGGDRAGEAAR